MSYPARGPGLPGIDGKASAARRRIDDVSISSTGNEAALVRHLARGPNLVGIDSKPSAAGRRIHGKSITAVGHEAASISGSYPTSAGIDGKASAASRRIDDVSITSAGNEAALARHPARGAGGGASTRSPVERVAGAKALIRKPFAGLVLATVIVMLSGCPATTEKTARPNERWYDAVVEPLQSEPERALRFYDRIIRLKAADLAQELEAARQSYEREKTELGRVQLAMILSLPGAAFRDDHAADQLLLPYVKDRSLEQSPLRPLALLLHAQLAENRRMDEALQQQAAKTKEEQRKAAEAQQKLEALLEMEMKMLEREQTIPPKKK